MTKLQLIWLSGLLEGEGSFVYTNTPQLAIQSTDKDIVERVCKLFGKNTNIVNSYDPNKYKHKLGVWRKRVYYIAVHGYRAAEIMRKIYRYMGKRRRIKIKEILDLFKKQKRIFNKRKDKFELRGLQQ